jgi:hypothetical protein
MVGRLIAGGQTGVDRAALDVAIGLGIPASGWCPRGRRAEDGVIPNRYPLAETPSEDYAERTAWNFHDADATLILTWATLTGGTLLTLDVCVRQGKLHLVVDLADVAGRERAVEAARLAGDRGGRRYAQRGRAACQSGAAGLRGGCGLPARRVRSGPHARRRIR